MLYKRTIAHSILVAALVLVGLYAAPRPAESLPLNLTALSASTPSIDELFEHVEPVRAETLSYVIQAGEVLIFNLPGILNERNISAYRIKRAPALSWLVTRSFFWRTLAKDAGKHEIHFEALVSESPVENVVVIVDVR